MEHRGSVHADRHGNPLEPGATVTFVHGGDHVTGTVTQVHDEVPGQWPPSITAQIAVRVPAAALTRTERAVRRGTGKERIA
jgi:hypothetical protein